MRQIEKCVDSSKEREKGGEDLLKGRRGPVREREGMRSGYPWASYNICVWLCELCDNSKNNEERKLYLPKSFGTYQRDGRQSVETTSLIFLAINWVLQFGITIIQVFSKV